MMMEELIHPDHHSKVHLHLDDMEIHLGEVRLHPVRHLGALLVLMVVLQIRDVLNLDANLPYLGELHLVSLDVHLDVMVAAQVDVALVDVGSRQLRMDCYLHEVGVEDYLLLVLESELLALLVLMAQLVPLALWNQSQIEMMEIPVN